MNPELSGTTRVLVIAGAPRCGTTAMVRYLGAHPAVCASQPKETHFFLATDSADDIARSRAIYRHNHFPKLSPEHEMLLDGSISYLYRPDAAKRALSVFPESRFLVMLRNPVDLVHSYHSRLLFYRQETEADLSRAWQLQDLRRNGEQVPWTCSDPKMLDYLEVGSIGRNLKALLDIVGRDRCHWVFYDDFLSDPLRCYRQVLSFADLPYDGRTDFPRKAPHRTYRSKSLQFLNSGAFLMALLPVNPKSTALYGRLARATRPLRRLLRRANSTEKPREKLDDGTRSMLAKAFLDDIAALESLTGRNLDSWRMGVSMAGSSMATVAPGQTPAPHTSTG
ncbi:MAG: sulfotransferase [Dongiaceae bacterium]